jgi:hypothetical protein
MSYVFPIAGPTQRIGLLHVLCESEYKSED